MLFLSVFWPQNGLLPSFYIVRPNSYTIHITYNISLYFFLLNITFLTKVWSHSRVFIRKFLRYLFIWSKHIRKVYQNATFTWYILYDTENRWLSEQLINQGKLIFLELLFTINTCYNIILVWNFAEIPEKLPKVL